MKNLKKILALVLALAMVLSMSAVVFADDDTTTEDPLAGHSFTAYQIFSGTQTDAEGDSSLGNIAWGSGINAEGDNGFLAALKASTAFGTTNPFASCTTAKSVAEVMTGTDWADGSANAKAFAALAHNYVKGDGAEPGDSLDAGYYLVVDTTTPTSTEGFAYNLSLLQLTKKSTFDVAPKIGVPEVIKKILDNGEVDVNEAAVGETVDYQITGTMPTNIADYKEYYYQFNDTLSKGLTYNKGSLTITIGTVDVTEYFYVNASAYSATNGTTIKATIGDLLALNNLDGVSITADTEVVITYSATVNKNAVIAGEGNPNEVTLKYSNNPNNSGEGTPVGDEPVKPTTEPGTENPIGETPKDEVKTFVTEVTVLKTDSENPLTGAEFELTGDTKTVKLSNGWKIVADENGEYYKLKEGTYTKDAPHTTSYMKEDETGDYVVGTSDKAAYVDFNKTVDGVAYRLIETDEELAEGTIRYKTMTANASLYDLDAGRFSKVNGDEWVDSTGSTAVKAFVDSTGTLTFSGLGAGDYTLTETTTPDGYNTIDPIDFTIVFTPDEEGELTGEFTVESEDATFTASENKFTVTVVNQKGSTLPETGGIGTTIFYILGSVLLAGAAIVLVTKKRMSAEG